MFKAKKNLLSEGLYCSTQNPPYQEKVVLVVMAHFFFISVYSRNTIPFFIMWTRQDLNL